MLLNTKLIIISCNCVIIIFKSILSLLIIACSKPTFIKFNCDFIIDLSFIFVKYIGLVYMGPSHVCTICLIVCFRS